MGFVMVIADYGLFYEVDPFNVETSVQGKASRLDCQTELKTKGVNCVLVHLFAVLPPVGHVLPPSQVLLAAKSAARWTPL